VEENLPSSSSDEEEGPLTYNGGTRIMVYEDEERDNKPSFKVLGRSKSRKESKWCKYLLQFLNILQNKVTKHTPMKALPIFTEHTREGITFRGHPNFRGTGRWNHWAIVDWGKREGKVPCRIWCFVKLRNMPTTKRLSHAETYLEDGTFAVVESTKYSDDLDEIVESDLFVPLSLETNKEDSRKRKFYLANVDAFAGTCAVVPDVGGSRNAYFQVKSREKWVEEFVVWLKQPHKDDEIDNGQ
jgi:hypothetical protein